MFPSILTSRSRGFIVSEGIYSSARERRLRTTADDWNHFTEHIQNAAASMTPAVLQGYERFRFSGSDLAYVKKSENSALSKTPGFLVYGLSSEALACLDSLLEEGGPKHAFNDRSKGEEKWGRTQMERNNVKVSINAIGGDRVEIDAFTFVITKDKSLEGGKTRQWDVNEFSRSPLFNKLNDMLPNGELIAQEKSIASAIGTTLELPGDHLVANVLQNKANDLETLLYERYDVDAPSAEYGTALQAAAVKGNLHVLQILIEAGANVNARGGPYGCPLIAAVVENQTAAVKLLLRYRANVFTPGGRYISAIYQAVDFSNVEVTHMLLEKGAWLTDDYGELLDLAAERGNHYIRNELETYDVRDFQPARGVLEQSSSRGKRSTTPLQLRSGEKDQDQDMVKRQTSNSLQRSGPVGVVLLLEAARLRGQGGKWTGIKGVTLLRLALANGVSENIIKNIRPFMHSWPSIQRFLAGAFQGKLGDMLQPVQHTNLLGGEESLGDGERGKHAERKERLSLGFNHASALIAH